MDNPYQAPQYQTAQTVSAGGEITPLVIEALRGTKGWVRFMAVLGFIACAFMLLAIIGVLVGGSGYRGAGPPAVLAMVYLVFLGIYFFLALRLNQYASRIGQFLAYPDGTRLASALDAQRGFWKCLGIMTIVMIVLYILFIVVLVGLFARGMNI